MREESQYQAECYKWMWNKYPHFRGLFFSFANESASKQQSAKRKALGLVIRPGTSDFHFDLPNAKNIGLKIEFKTAKGRVSDVQKEYRDIVEALGYRYEVIRPPLSNFISLIDNYIKSVENNRLETLKKLYHEKHLPAFQKRQAKKR